MSVENGHKELRDLTDAADPPLIPFLGSLLHDLTLLEESPSKINNDQINWGECSTNLL